MTPVPGTTRDALREAIEIEGVPLTLVDTAGLRASADAVEQLGIERTRRELAQADLVLLVEEAGKAETPPHALPPEVERIVVYNKLDLAPQFMPPAKAVAVSAKTGQGLADLRAAILAAAWGLAGVGADCSRGAGGPGPFARIAVGA